MLDEQIEAPDFVAIDDNGQNTALQNLLTNKYLLLYFYPKDNTPGCTTEAEAMRDLSAELDQAGIKVVGVSVDSVDSHKKFKHDFNLNYPLLSDADQTICKKYDVLDESGRADRASYLINSDGIIIKSYYPVDPINHTQQVLLSISKLN